MKAPHTRALVLEARKTFTNDQIAMICRVTVQHVYRWRGGHHAMSHELAVTLMRAIAEQELKKDAA